MFNLLLLVFLLFLFILSTYHLVYLVIMLLVYQVYLISSDNFSRLWHMRVIFSIIGEPFDTVDAYFCDLVVVPLHMMVINGLFTFWGSSLYISECLKAYAM